MIVAGGGPAGMMAAIAAAETGHTVTLFEQNEKLGKKLFITGKGRCNVTNDSDVENLLQNVVKNPKFLYSAFYAFDSSFLMDFFRQEGLALKTERGNRVFPVSDKSSDVIRTLQNALVHRGVDIQLCTTVRKLLQCDGQCCGVRAVRGNREWEQQADAVVVATGGISYPSTGSTGDGYRFAEEAGHTIERLHRPLCR